MGCYIGLDVGSVSADLVVTDAAGSVLESLYVRTFGQPLKVSLEQLKSLLDRYDDVAGLCVTGSGAKVISDLLGVPYVNEIVAQSKGTLHLHPDVRTIIEIGGEDTKLIQTELGEDGRPRVADFAMNTLCAAGTGSFLDQQASRLMVSIEEFSRLALKSVHPPRVAGRCSVFAKTDMIHLQQQGTADYDIIAGLCHAMARNFRSNLARGKSLASPIAFQGGVALNVGMVRAFTDVLGLKDGELVIPDQPGCMGALGAVLDVLERGAACPLPLAGLKPLEDYLHRPSAEAERLPALRDDGYEVNLNCCELPRDRAPIDAYVGVDVGSISTNVVVINSDKEVIARRYLMTEGRPLEAVKRALYEVGEEIGHRVVVRGCCTTGSGRYLTGGFVGADIVKNEITTHARGAVSTDPEVDTIFEIGGQDAKYISLEGGAVVDFAMNKVCAAGTGSFLEEQAERLGLKIEEEFGRTALASRQPVKLGERCTVFMESDLNYHQQHGVATEDLVGGLSYSIVYNYLSRVVEDRKIGDRIFFQGGVAFNRGVKAAFEHVTGKKITVPPHQDVLGAVGAAIIAMEGAYSADATLRSSASLRAYSAEAASAAKAGSTRAAAKAGCYSAKQRFAAKHESNGESSPSTSLGAVSESNRPSSSFRGFDLRSVRYDLSTFECKGCSNRCEIHKVSIEGQKSLHYGSRCGKFDEKKYKKGEHLPRLFEEREQALLLSYPKDSPDDPIGVTIGIPRALTFFDLYPLWKAFFIELGCQVVLSEPTNRSLISKGNEHVTAETCFPIQVAHGHVADLIEKGVDHIFVPSVINMEHEAEGIVHSYVCPLVQSLPYLLRAAFEDKQRDGLPPSFAACEAGFGGRSRLLSPIFQFERGRKAVSKRLRRLAKTFRASGARTEKAIAEGWKALDRFRSTVRKRGQEILDGLGDGESAVVIISRAYNGCDDGINLAVPDKLRDLGVLALPIDFLPLELTSIQDEFPHMFWKYGQSIIAAAKYIAARDNLHAVYITNFRCGPDSFISKFFGRVLGKPYLTLEIDEHSADVGAITRCEAFLDSIRSARKPVQRRKPCGEDLFFDIRQRTDNLKVYIPYMLDHGFVMAAMLRANGINAEALPPSDSKSVEVGRRFTTGKECFPCILTTGDIVKKTQDPDFDPNHSAFFMPQSTGPCRFGQYHKFHRMVLDEIGLEHVPMVILDQTDKFAEHSKAFGPRFYRTSWDLLLIVDYMKKVVQEIRPYEINDGETDALYQRCLQELADTVESKGHYFAKAAEIRRRLERIPVDRSYPRPLIGIVGEIYVRSNAFANNFLVRRLERFGAEVLTPPFQEWISYIADERRVRCRERGRFLGLAKECLVEMIARRNAGRIARIFQGAIRHMPREQPISAVQRLGSRYLHPTVKGEAILSMGRSVEYAQHGYNGIVNVVPFGCMPGAIVDSLLEKLRRDYDGIPVLKLAFDGIEHASEATMLEAFVRQARDYMTSKRKVSSQRKVK